MSGMGIARLRRWLVMLMVLVVIQPLGPNKGRRADLDQHKGQGDKLSAGVQQGQRGKGQNPTSNPRQDKERKTLLTQRVLELAHHLQLPVVVVRAGTAIGILKAVEGIGTNRLPEVVTAGAADLINGLLLEKPKAALQVLDLGDGHGSTQQ